MKDKNKNIKLRLIIIGTVFSLLQITIGARAVYLQVFKETWLSRKAANQYERSYTYNGKRGGIYDRNNEELAVSIDAVSISAYPRDIINAENVSKAIMKTIDDEPEKIIRKLSSEKNFVWLKRHALPKEVDTIKNLELEGIGFIPEHSRVYPNRTLASQLIGFSGIDNNGLEGLEFYYDRWLKGCETKHKVIRDALGRRLDTGQKENLTFGGNNLILTIDRTIQYITEKSLQKAVNDFSAVSGMAIVMVPKTGAILAMANVPLFNPNSFTSSERDTWRNRVVTDSFEPGSTMKIFLAAAAIDSGLCTPETIFFCENGKYKIGNNIIGDTHPHEWLSLQQVVKFSSNIGAVKAAETIGKTRLYSTLRSFGFGCKTGVDSPGETSGSLSPPSLWSKIDTGAISFGQGVSVSSIQLITAVSAVANDGIRMKPFIVQAITDKDGRLVKKTTPQRIKNAVSPKTAKMIKQIMQTVITTGGTGEKAALEGYTVCGKTGTAQKINKHGKYTEGDYIASFIGFAPEKNPEIAVLVVVNGPQQGLYGGVVAAPAFRKIVHATLSYMNIPPREGNINILTVSNENGFIG